MTAFFDSLLNFEKDLNMLTVAFRILLAVIFGGVIGIERGRHGSQAGLRTHILVCLGGTMTALVGAYSTELLGYGGDPFRIAAQVVSGIGFLGAGMIVVKNDKMITGLTTAAIMWTTAIIGIALGIGFYSGAFLAMLACVFTAAVLTRIEHKRKKTMRIYIEVNQLDLLEEITEHLKRLLPPDAYVEVTAPKSATAGNMGVVVISARVADTDALKAQIKAHGGIHFIIIE
ncbi:MAG: MgtC/SapB family protein [Clostridia bacterium]|nr:MgtC/SapB family protein [Clostridia bacterium]